MFFDTCHRIGDENRGDVLEHGKSIAADCGYCIGDSCWVASSNEFVGSSLDDGIATVSAVIHCVAGIHGDGCQITAV